MMKMNTISRRENWHPMTEQGAIAIVEDCATAHRCNTDPVAD
jgi:hypothetical protein